MRCSDSFGCVWPRAYIASLVANLDVQALIDGPANVTGVSRQVINFKWIALTDLKVKVARNARQKTLAAAWKEADTKAKFEGSAWGKKLASKAAKAKQTDFQRFQARLTKQTVMAKVNKAIKA